MPRTRKSLLWAGLAIGIGGCASGPEVVWVDLSRADDWGVALSQSQTPASPAAPAIPSAAGSVPARPAASVMLQVDNRQAQEAQIKIRASQERTYQELRRVILEGLRVELDREEAKARDSVLAAYDEGLNSAFTELRRLFEAHAAQVGPRADKLAWAAQIPDRDPKSRRPPRAEDYLGQQYFKLAKQMRVEIDSLNKDYRAQVEDILDKLRQDLRTDLQALDDAFPSRLEELERTAEARAREAALQAMRQLERTAFDPERRLPAIPAASASGAGAPGLPASPGQQTDMPGRSGALLAEEVVVFAQSMGYRLSNRFAAGRDATEEFREWRKRRWSGR